MKRCTKCKQVKMLDLFHKNPKSRDGRASQCKVCAHAQIVASRKTPEAKARWKLYARRSALRNRYGIDEKTYDQMLAKQGFGCAVCGKPHATFDNFQRRLHVDHDKKTGNIRGLLCNGCNRGIGLFSDDPTLLRKAAKYLEVANGEKDERSESYARIQARDVAVWLQNGS